MSTELSAGVRSLQPSPTAQLFAQVDTLRRSGQDIISLNVGEPDYDTPEYIKEEAMRALTQNFTKYTPGMGIPELREAIAGKLASENHVTYQTDEIIVTVGAKQALSAALTAIAGQGDEVIIPIPGYVSYPEMVRMCGASPILVPQKPDFSLDLDAIREAVTPNTKAVIICTPCNPTGMVYSEQELRRLGEMAVLNDFYILADEIYEKLIYGPYTHFTVASASEAVKAHTILVNGFSKTYAMTGWRIGYACGPKPVISAMNKIISQTTTSVNSIAQRAGVAALTGPQDAVETMRQGYARRRDYAITRLRAMPGVICPEARGAFYLFVDVTSFIGKTAGDLKIDNDIDLCSFLLNHYHVAVMPGSAFYGPGYIRICYAVSMEQLTKAMDRMEEGFAALLADDADALMQSPSKANYERFLQAMQHPRQPVENPRVVYQGEPGAYSEKAAMNFFGEDVKTTGLSNFKQAFEMLKSGEADYAVLPIENSSTGAIRQVYDLLAQYECYVVGETTVAVNHSLLGLPGATLQDIERVYSHEQGLFQCEEYLADKPWRKIPGEDTAGSARYVAEQGDIHKAAICSAHAAKIYGLQVLAEGISTNGNNTTRFYVISPELELREGRDKISISITTAHHSGSLHEVLTIFALNGLNLVKLESRPIQGQIWEYMFFIEFTGSLTDSGMDKIMQTLSDHVYDLKVFGNVRQH